MSDNLIMHPMTFLTKLNPSTTTSVQLAFATLSGTERLDTKRPPCAVTILSFLRVSSAAGGKTLTELRVQLFHLIVATDRSPGMSSELNAAAIATLKALLEASDRERGRRRKKPETEVKP